MSVLLLSGQVSRETEGVFSTKATLEYTEPLIGSLHGQWMLWHLLSFYREGKLTARGSGKNTFFTKPFLASISFANMLGCRPIALKG